MESTIKQRLNKLIEYLAISKREFERRINVSNGYLNQLKHMPKEEILERISIQFPELNISWLLTGEGEMLKSEAQQSASLPATEKSRIRYWVDVDATAGGLTMFEDNPMSRCIEMHRRRKSPWRQYVPLVQKRTNHYTQRVGGELYRFWKCLSRDYQERQPHGEVSAQRKRCGACDVRVGESGFRPVRDIDR